MNQSIPLYTEIAFLFFQYPNPMNQLTLRWDPSSPSVPVNRVPTANHPVVSVDFHQEKRYVLSTGFSPSASLWDTRLKGSRALVGKWVLLRESC